MTAPSRRQQQTRALAVARAGWGLLCLLRPQDVVQAAGTSPDRHATTFTRVLGGRELAQAAVTAASPTAAVVRAGTAVDLLHALSMAALAGLDRTRRRPALLNALTATTWALLTHLSRPVTPTRPDPLPSQPARHPDPAGPPPVSPSGAVMTRPGPQRQTGTRPSTRTSTRTSTDETGDSPLHGAAFDKDLHQTPPVLWLGVGLMCLGVALIGGAVVALSRNTTIAVGLLVAGVVLGAVGAAVGLRNHIMASVE